MTINVLDIHHGFNFRDLGGYQTKSGQTIKMHKVIRSGNLNQLSDRDVNYLANYGVVEDVDFRSPKERAKDPDHVPTGAAYHAFPVFPTDETKNSAAYDALQAGFAKDPHAGFENMVKTYEDIVREPTAQKAYRNFFDTLLATSAPDQSVLFHCSAGKDRTGMGAVYLLTILGVDQATIRQDYLAANDYLKEATAQIIEETRANHGSEALVSSITDLWSVRGAYLDSAMATIESDYGSLDHYLSDALQITPDQQRDLRALYLD